MSAAADRNLLFGILAVQLDFVTSAALVAAMNAWLLDKVKPLGDILRDRGDMSAEELEHLSALVEIHLKRHGNDPHQSLAVLSTIPPTLRQQLAALPDVEVQQSIANVGAVKADPSPSAPDPYQTVAQPSAPLPAVRYRILRPHARGGLGEVFVAEDVELGRNVALKEIQNRFADDATSRDRFVREAEITGGLEHPGIVPVYGLGSYADGRPFYAMRFIRGDNLKAALRRFHGLKVGSASDQPAGTVRFDALEFRQILRRFIDVCNAIAYAHSRGVLHRDLKPGNIMLGKYGETLVVDWGLAKPTGRSGDRADPEAETTLQPRSGGESSATVAGQALGTPAYMSPEQAAGMLDELGPPADVYSLGATLYELLTGRVSFPELDLDAVQKGAFPPPRQIVPGVPRPLEAVCLKAMALKPGDRYGTPLELAAEIEHWLADEPVTAWREPMGVRAWRWVRRHRTLATTAAALVAAAAVALGVLAIEKERARVAVESERDQAREQKRRTREALDTMTSHVVADWLGTQKELLPQQSEFLQLALGYYKEFSNEAANDAEGRKRVGDAQFRVGRILQPLGRAAEAEAAYRAALAIQELLVSQNSGVSEYLAVAANTHHNLSILLLEIGKPAEAEEHARAAVANFETLAAGRDGTSDFSYQLATHLNVLGVMLEKIGKRTEARAALRNAELTLERSIAESPSDRRLRTELAGVYMNQSNSLARLGNRADAVKADRKALGVLMELVVAYPSVVELQEGLESCHHNLGLLLFAEDDIAAGTAELQAAIVASRRLSTDHPGIPKYASKLAGAQSYLGTEMARMGKLKESQVLLRESLTVRERLVRDYPATKEFAVELGGAYCNMGNMFRYSEPRASLDWFKRAIDTVGPMNTSLRGNMGTRQYLRNAFWGRAKALTKLGQYPESLSDWNKAIQLVNSDSITEADDRAEMILGRADCRARMGDISGALTEADTIAGGAKYSAFIQYNVACIYSLAAGVAPPNSALADQYGARAVGLLRRAFTQGYQDFTNLLADADIAPLRGRDDFAALLWDLAETQGR